MAQAQRDENRVTTLIGVSSSDGLTPTLAYVDPITHELLVDSSGGTSGQEKIVYASDATYDYYAFAIPGSSTGSAIWKAIRIDENGQVTHADGNANYDNVATNISSLSYS